MYLVKRTISSLVGFPVMTAFVVAGGIPLQAGLFILAVVGMYEMYHATLNHKAWGLKAIAYFFTAVYYIMIGNVDSVFSVKRLMFLEEYFSNFLLIFSALFIIALLMALVLLHEKTGIGDCAQVLFGFFHVGFLLSFIYLVRQYTLGNYFVWLIFIAAWGCDTFAYFTGITLGKHKLTPVLSPKKTVEGAIGGVVGAAVLAGVYGFVISRTFALPETHIVLFCSLAGGIGAVFAQFGDLAASAIKRATGVKDYGKIIPGHGGVIDRFDSVLFTAPVVYMVMFLLLNFYR